MEKLINRIFISILIICALAATVLSVIHSSPAMLVMVIIAAIVSVILWLEKE